MHIGGDFPSSFSLNDRANFSLEIPSRKIGGYLPPPQRLNFKLFCNSLNSHFGVLLARHPGHHCWTAVRGEGKKRNTDDRAFRLACARKHDHQNFVLGTELYIYIFENCCFAAAKHEKSVKFRPLHYIGFNMSTTMRGAETMVKMLGFPSWIWKQASWTMKHCFFLAYHCQLLQKGRHALRKVCSTKGTSFFQRQTTGSGGLCAMRCSSQKSCNGVMDTRSWWVKKVNGWMWGNAVVIFGDPKGEMHRSKMRGVQKSQDPVWNQLWLN